MGQSAAYQQQTSKAPAFGSLAYELQWQENTLDTPARAGEAQPNTQVRERAEQAIEQRVRYHVSPVLVLGGLAIAVMAVQLLFHYVTLTAISSQVVTLKSELKNLESQYVILTADYEQMFDLSSAKEVATERGMVKPSQSQMYYIDVSQGDSAVVHTPVQEPTLVQTIYQGVQTQVENAVAYFE